MAFRKQKTTDITPELPQNEYFESVSARLGILQVLLYLALLAFVILSFARNTELITYRNFYHFFRELTTSFEKIDVYKTESLAYSYDEEQSFTLYRKGLAVAGNNAVTVFTETGRQTVSQSLQYRDPVAKGSGKYLLVYELGGTQYSLYNSYTQIHTGVTERPIRGAAVSDCGMFAIVSSSEEHTSVVSLYSSNFALINRYSKQGYVMDLSINDDGSQIAILTSEANAGIYHTKLVLHRPRTEDPGTELKIGNALGWQCSYTADKTLAVLCADGISCIRDGKVQSFFDLGKLTVTAYSADNNGISVCLRDSVHSEQNQIVLFDKDGKILYNETLPYACREILRAGNAVYILHTAGVSCLDVKAKRITTYLCTTEQKTLLVPNENEILLCSPQKADCIKRSSFS